MKTMICGFIIGFIFGIILLICIDGFAFRMGKPETLTDLTQIDQITRLNNILDNFWDISNGRYTANVVISAPSGTVGTEGNFKFSKIGGVYKIHIFLDGGWKVWSSD